MRDYKEYIGIKKGVLTVTDIVSAYDNKKHVFQYCIFAEKTLWIFRKYKSTSLLLIRLQK